MHLHGGGQGFDSPAVHQPIYAQTRGSSVSCVSATSSVRPVLASLAVPSEMRITPGEETALLGRTSTANPWSHSCAAASALEPTPAVTPHRSGESSRRQRGGYNRCMDVHRTFGPGPARCIASWAAVIAAVLLLIGLSPGCSREGRGGLEGRVTGLDVFGDVVGYRGAKVIVRDKGDAARVALANSDANGRYRVALEPGDYLVDLFTGPHPKTPSKTMSAQVRDRTTSSLPTYRSDDYPRGSAIRNVVLHRIREVVRAEVERLALARDDASLTLYGSHAARTAALFGPVDLPADRHVYVVILEGDPTAFSPRGDETRALRGGGYVALLLTADDFETRAMRVSHAAWDRDAAATMFPPGVGLFGVY